MTQNNRRKQRTVDAVGLTQAIYHGLCEEITTGKLRPGETLSRRRIAERYGSSYTPVIEAIVRLEYTGLIEMEASQMARVRRVTLDAIHSDYVLREAVETQAIRLACESARDSDLDELYRLAEAVDTRAEGIRADSVADGPRLHWGFHKRIAELAGYWVLVRELERIAMVQRFHAIWMAPQAVEDPPRAHSRLIDAIKARVPDAADAEMRAHVRRGLENECHVFRLGAGLRP
jgi:DNA-binding GntR family transcriptional regulator